MYSLLRKVHMYTGLWNFTILFVFGVAGLMGTLLERPFQWNRPPTEVTYIPMSPPPPAGLNDRQLAEYAHGLVHVPLAGPVPPNLGHDDEHNLTMSLYTVNGMNRITVLEADKKLKVERQPQNTLQYLSTLHETTARTPVTDVRVRMWAWYNEIAIVSLILMSLSGVYLWLATRAKYRWAQVSFAAGTLLVAVLWMGLR